MHQGTAIIYALMALAIVGGALCVPNFVVIMADDLGYNDLSIYGNPDVLTPNIDRLAMDSVRFSSFYSHPTCAPTRASLLTGRFFMRTGVWGVHGARDYLNLDEFTVGDALREAGYRTGLFGKWHNGLTDGYLPWERGFDTACMVDLYIYKDNKAICNGQEVQTEGWVTERIADWAIEFIDENAERPFLLYLPLITPHLGKLWWGESENWHAPDEYVNKYLSKGLSESMSRLYGSIDFMDYNIGRVLWHIDRLRLDENTVIIFLSDNGPISKSLVTDEEWKRRNADELHGNKGEVWDNGIRVPLFVRWTNHFQPGIVQKAIAGVEDMFPTLTDLAGIGTGGGSKPLDGMSLVPVLNKPKHVGKAWTQRSLFRTIESPEWTRRDGIYRILPNFGTDKSALTLGNDGRWAIRKGRYKLINLSGSEFLYDMREDPAETTPLQDPLMADELHAELEAWWDELVAEPNSFTLPTFIIGMSDDSIIVAMGAVRASDDMTVLTHRVEGQVQPGDFLNYMVDVRKAGEYIAKLKRQGDWEGTARVAVHCAHKTPGVSGFVADDSVVGNVVLDEVSSDCIMEVVIESGTGFLSLEEIILTSAVSV